MQDEPEVTLTMFTLRLLQMLSMAHSTSELLENRQADLTMQLPYEDLDLFINLAIDGTNDKANYCC